MNFRNVPALRALRAFEASARYLSFTKAAEELFVTQAAVSLQVKQLEETLGVALFRRGSRSLTLTSDAHAYLPDVREALELLAGATARQSRRVRQNEVTISIMPSLACKWLIPMLPDLQRQHPEINLQISAYEWLPERVEDNVDLAIRHGSDNWKSEGAQRLMGEDVFPVCSPELLEGKPGLKYPQQLSTCALLHDDFSREDWSMWLIEAKVEGIDAEAGLRFSHTAMMLDAALAGAGIGLGRTPLVARDLDQGRLVAPFDYRMKGKFDYFLVRSRSSSDKTAVDAVADWLLNQGD